MEKPSAPPIAGPRRRRDAIVAVVLLVLSLPAMVAGLVVAVANGYNLGPVLDGRQRGAVVWGAIVASVPALCSGFFAYRVRLTKPRGGTAMLVLGTLVVAAIWLAAVIAMIV